MLLHEPQFSFVSRAGQKIELKHPHLTDAADLAHALQDQTVFDYIHTIPNPYTIKDAEEYIQFSIGQQIKGSVLNFGIFISGKIRGMIGIAMQDKFNGEFGYWLNINYRNQGIITAASKIVLKYAFKIKKVKRIGIRIIKENLPSIKIMKHLGIPQKYFREQELLYRDKHWDVLGFEITEESYPDICKKW